MCCNDAKWSSVMSRNVGEGGRACDPLTQFASKTGLPPRCVLSCEDSFGVVLVYGRSTVDVGEGGRLVAR